MDYISEFSTYLEVEKRYSSHTVTAYFHDVKLFFSFLEDTYSSLSKNETLLVKDIQYLHIRSWISDLSNNNRSHRTINRKLSSIKSYFNFLQKLGYVNVHPMEVHIPLKTSKVTKIPFSKDEMSLLPTKDAILSTDNFFELRDYLIIELLYGLGIRRSELISLRWNVLDFKNKQVRIIGKGKKERLLPLLDLHLSFLNKYLLMYKLIYVYAPDTYIFLTNNGKKLYGKFVFRRVNKYLNLISSKKDKSPHILRHTFATHLLQSGADLNAVKELLGHSSLVATQIYIHNDIKRLSEVYKNCHPRDKNI